MTIFNKDLLEYSNCIICKYKNNIDNDNNIVIYDCEYDVNWIIIKCQCNLRFLYPRINAENINSFYSNDYSPHEKNKNYIYKNIQKYMFHVKEYILNKYIIKNSKILDYGSGDGKFSEYMKSKKYNIDSFDPYVDKNNDLAILSKNKYDCITMWHSLEHIHDIDQLFENINNMLNDKGYLFVAVPNFNSVDRKFFKNNWVAYDAPRHLYHFTKQTFTKLLESKNYKIIKSLPLYQDTLFNTYYSNKFPILLKLIILPIIILFFYITIIFDKNKSSSNMYVCIKK